MAEVGSMGLDSIFALESAVFSHLRGMGTPKFFFFTALRPNFPETFGVFGKSTIFGRGGCGLVLRK